MGIDHIICNFQPFSIEQDIMVYIKGECVYQTKVSLDRVNHVVSGLKKQYNIDRITLCGNQNYLSRFAAEMKLAFNDNDCEIEIIDK